MEQRSDFRPHTIEVTTSLDLTGLDEDEAEKMCQRLYAGSDHPALSRIVGGLQAAQRLRIIIQWAKWLQFVRAVALTAEGTEQRSEPKATDELTTRYRVVPR